MRKNLLFISLTLLIFVSLLSFSHPVSAELTAGVQVGYGTNNHSKILGISSPEFSKTTEWSRGLWANFAYDDVLFTALYRGANTLQEKGLSHNLIQASANYLFLQEDMLQVYGGIGYNFLNTTVENTTIEGGKKSTLTGHGFIGQVVVDIAISEQIKTSTTISGNPWLKWSFGQGGTTSNVEAGPSFTYQINVNYDFSTENALQIGLMGGNYKIPAFSTTGFPDKGETKGSYSGISLGLVHHF